ncbi:protein kinase, partial [Candidatus Latescibacterota bacterium]
MASVYLAHEISLDRDVAIKLLPEEFLHDQDFVERFKREAQIAAKLEHPNIVRIYQIDESEGLYYFVMSYIPEGSIGDQIIKRGALPLHYIVLWGSEICSALAYAHKYGVIHRDLKPDNIMIDLNGSAIVMDFGIARAAQGARLTLKGQVIGSPQYMSPEQARGMELDIRSDIYSMGIVLYQMATGTLPFQSSEITSLMYMHVHEKPEPPDLRNPKIPKWLGNIILNCLAKKPEERFKNAKELRKVLNEQKTSTKQHSIITKVDKSRQKWSSNQVIDILKKVPMFKGLIDKQIKKVFQISSIQKLAKDDLLCQTGSESNHLFILISGSLQAI